MQRPGDLAFPSLCWAALRFVGRGQEAFLELGEFIEGGFVEPVFHALDPADGLRALPARLCALEVFFDGFQEAVGAHDQGAQTPAEVADAAVAADHDEVPPVGRGVYVPLDNGIGGLVAGGIHHFESGRASKGGDGVGPPAAAVEDDLGAFTGRAAEPGDPVDEGVARGLEVLTGEGLELGTVVNDVVTVYYQLKSHSESSSLQKKTPIGIYSSR